MNKYYTFALITLFLAGITSCETETDPIYQPLIGTYESSIFNEYLGLNYVTVYIFSKNGRFEVESFLRNADSKEIEHYNYVMEGNFRATQNTIVVENHEIYLADTFRAANDSRKEDLIKAIPGSTSFTIEYELRNSRNEFFIPGFCIDDACSQDQTFKRIN